MYDFRKITMGLAPTRRDMFEAHRKDEINKRVTELAAKFDVTLVGIEDATKDGLVLDNKDVPKIVKKFIAADVDCIFVPHANFGQEEAVAKLCKAVGKPVLLWGPRDPAPLGLINQFEDRLYDVQCGLFATGKALLSYQIPFTYIENCWLDSPVLEKGFDDFIRAVCAARAVKKARIGQLSVRPWQFLSVRSNENELLEKFGVEVVPLESNVIRKTIRDVLNNKEDEIENKLKLWQDYVDFSEMGNDDMRKIAAANIGIRSLAEEHGCQAMAGECWAMLQDEFGIMACFVWGSLTSEGLPVTCETDILGALGSAMAYGATRNDTAPFFADITVRHPENDNAELLWHCGPFPYRDALDKNAAKVIDGKGHWEQQGGDITVLRFGCQNGRYSLFADEGKSTDGPKTNGTYLWFEVDDWPKWERKFVTGPYIHHVSGIHGKYKNVLHEALKYIGEIYPDSAD